MIFTAAFIAIFVGFFMLVMAIKEMVGGEFGSSFIYIGIASFYFITFIYFLEKAK